MTSVESMDPYGLALWDAFMGEQREPLIIVRDDGHASELPLDLFVGNPLEQPIDRLALNLCHGRVLDAGAGAGRDRRDVDTDAHGWTRIL